MNIVLWLDDVRNPKDNMWHSWIVKKGYNPFNHNVVWIKNYYEFTDWIEKNGLPAVIFFDHDLADINPIENSDIVLATDWNKEKTGYDCAKWLIDYCIDNDQKLPNYMIQSANPVGAENIDKLLKNYIRYEQ